MGDLLWKGIRVLIALVGSTIMGFSVSIALSAIMGYLLWLMGHSLEDPMTREICLLVALHFGIALTFGMCTVNYLEYRKNV